ncbi:hypothetical protein [Afipia clevelandensis]|nr:hypothetical protein [Afipia clevelandensis]
METCDLSRLSGIGFERLVRALCFEKLGPAGVVYSSGPDGGRDFTYDGAIKGYEGRNWSGYLVIQAKYKDAATSIDDLAWFKRTLDIELEKFRRARNVLKKPKYYIIATNLRLSGADGKSSRGRRKGGLTKALEYLELWKKELGVTDVDIWSYDKIVDMLVGQPAIRHTYAAWVTPGDVLTKVLERFDSQHPNFSEIVSRSLKHQLFRDQFVRLKDAGSVGDLQIRTSQVFVDLPLMLGEREQNLLIHNRGLSNTENLLERRSRVVSALVERSREKLDPDSLEQDEERQGNDERRPSKNRIVLIGGPGQGKSTASLFLAQLFRSAILEKHPGARRDQTVRALIPEILKRAQTENIGTALPHRYPIHISLPRFADQISQARTAHQQVPSVIAYIASELSLSSDDEVTRSEIRNWLRAHPWIVLFDGLDEVPPSGERSAIIDAISNFFLEVSEVNADVLAVVTTRPQGYNHDLDEKLWEHWRLAELKPEQALAYAGAFGEVRYKDDLQRRLDVHRQLQKAAAQTATARLMVSPLQVTILYFIVDTGGGVPTARWTLFNEYFEVLKRREKAKGGETQRILERYLHRLGPIHHRAGLVLQTDSEHGGGARSRLSHERFRSLVRSYLLSEGFEASKVEEGVEDLMSLALHRLVLLSSQEEGSISFDVRSLQEFMAAAAITSGDESIMEKRLAHLAGNSHWRHVFQIAASRCFSDDSFHYRRSAIVAIPRQLDAVEPDRLCLNGTRLALDLVADGIGFDHPLSRRPLILHAMEQLSLGSDLDPRISAIWDEADEEVIAHHITTRIGEVDSVTRSAIWNLLFLFSAMESKWANSTILKWLPQDNIAAMKIIGKTNSFYLSQEVLDRLYMILKEIGPAPQLEELYRLFYALKEPDRFNERDVEKLRLLSIHELASPEGAGRKDIMLELPQSDSRTIVNYASLNMVASFEKFGGSEFDADAWIPLRASLVFLRSPCAESLALSLEMIAKPGIFENSKVIIDALPWPIASIVDAADSADDLYLRSTLAFEGQYGDLQDWLSAETRWDEFGISEADLIASTKEWFSKDVARIGCPRWILAETNYVDDDQGLALAARIYELASHSETKGVKDKFLELAHHVTLFGVRRPTLENAETYLDLLAKGASEYIPMEGVLNIPDEALRVRAIVHKLAVALREARFDEYELDSLTPPIMKAFNAFPDERELLYPLLSAISVQKRQFDFSTLSSAAVSQPGDSPRTRAATAALSLLVGDEGEVKSSIDILVQEPIFQPGLDLAEQLLTSSSVSVERRIHALSALIEATSHTLNSSWRQFVGPLHIALDSRKSGLTVRETWVDQLRLPSDAFGVVLPNNGL